jgi:hypothetical protein
MAQVWRRPVLRIVDQGATDSWNVTLCTRPLVTAQRVIGTVCLEAVELAEIVIFAAPLARFGWLIDAVTPFGNPVTRKPTEPVPYEYTCAVATACPEDIV